MTTHDAELALYQGVDRLWAGRALEMFRHLAPTITTISALEIPPDWPLSGAISFRRDADGHHVQLMLVDKTFRGVASPP